ncbi:MAG: N-acetylglucosamine-6-phosphate deacetylase, partial [Acidobacteriota bacterium]
VADADDRSLSQAQAETGNAVKEFLLDNARVIFPDGQRRGGALIRDGRIAQVFSDGERPAGISDRVDLRDNYLAPGLIDIHIHGSRGVDIQNADEEGLRKLSEFLLSEGVTRYFATFVPADEKDYREAIPAVARYIERQDGVVAKISGIHFEGPYVSHKRCGALRPRFFRTYDGDARSLDLFATGCPTLATVAPEISGGLDLIRDLSSRGARVFIGHSAADVETLDRAFEMGARHITHFPNALDPLHHRNPGAVGWGLVRKDVTMDCIADFHHVHPLMLKLMHQAKGPHRLALISDAISPAGLGDGEFAVWGERISVADEKTALVEGAAKGALAGSVITLRQAMKNFIHLGASIHEAVLMCSLTPARIAGIDRECGSIEEGKRADLVAFDEELRVRLAVVDGEVRRIG